MSPHTGRKYNANCSKKENITNPSVKTKKGKSQNMPNAGKENKTMNPPRRIFCTRNKMIHIYSQNTTENPTNASRTEIQINANHTGENKINISSKKNELKYLRIPNDSDFSEEEGALEKVNEKFDSFLGGDADQSFRNKKLNINLMSITQKDQNIPIYRYKYMCKNQKKTATMVVTVLVKEHSPQTANQNEIVNQKIKEEDTSYNEDNIEDPIVNNEGAIYDSDGYEIIDVDLF